MMVVPKKKYVKARLVEEIGGQQSDRTRRNHMLVRDNNDHAKSCH
jgi:hypothetical protein